MMPWRKNIEDYVKGAQRMKRYVTVVILNEDLSKTVVIRKDRGPAHLIGKLNGIGGKIEPGESLYEAAVREVREECGLVIDKRTLDLIGNLSDIDYKWDVACFVVCLTDDEMAKASSLTSEQVDIWKTPSLLAEASVDPDFIHLLYEALRMKSRQRLYDGSRGLRFSSS